MKRIFFVLLVVAVVAVWCTPAFAARQLIVAGGPTPLDANGVTDGVDMTGPLGSTLTVGVFGGPQMDIFTNNAGPLAPIPEAVSTNAGAQHDIVFNTSSNVNGVIGGPTLLFRNITLAGGAGATVNFLGTVFTTTMNVDVGTANFNSGTLGAAGNQAAVTFTGDGTINVAANTSVTGALNPAGAQTGTLNLMGAAAGVDQWTGAVGAATGMRSINVDSGSTAGVTSQITGAVDTYAFDLGTNTLNIVGAMNLRAGPGGAINTTLASASVYGHIVETGGVASYTGANVTVNVTVAAGTVMPVGTLFTIVNAGGGATGTPVVVTIAGGTNPLYTFTAVPTNVGDVQIQLTGVPLAIPEELPPEELPASLPFATPVSITLQNITDPSADLLEVMAALNALTNPGEIVNAEAQLAPSTPALAAPLVAFQGTRQFQNLWLSRLETCSRIGLTEKAVSADYTTIPRRGVSSGEELDETLDETGIWAKGFGYYGHQGDRGAFTGYNSGTLGTMIAVDRPLFDDNTRAGLGFGYAWSEIDGKTFDASVDVNSYQGTAYIGHERGPWFVNGNESFTWNQYSGSRHILFTGMDRTADSDYGGQDYTLFAITGYHIDIAEFILTPLASFQYTHMRIGGYTETGAGDINLKVDSQDYDFFESGLGGKLEREFSLGRGIYVPEVHFKWLHTFNNPELEQTAAFTAAGSGTFKTPGLKTSDNTFNAGIGLVLFPFGCESDEWSIETVYDFDWRNDDYWAHRGMIRIAYRF